MLRVGIIGTRGMGARRALVCAARDDCVVTCIAGRDEQSLRARADEIGCDCVLDAAELRTRADVDAVVVATPNSSHRAFGMMALAAGKHLFMEYPLGVDLAQCDELIAAARTRGLTMAVGNSDRFEPQHLCIKRRLGRLGRPLFAQAWCAYEKIWKWADDDAVMGDYFALVHYHHVDQFIDLFGPVEWVSATLAREQDEGGRNTMLSGTVQMGFGAGMAACSQFAMGAAGRLDRSVYVLGSEGSLRCGPDGMTWSHSAEDGEIVDEPVDPKELEQEFTSFEGDFGLFADAAQAGRPCVLSGAIARHSCEVCFACSESADSGRRVPIGPPDADVQLP